MRTIRLEIEGMTCAGCETAVVRALTRVPGVARARASAAKKEAEVDADGAVLSEALAGAVRAAGFTTSAG